MSTRFHAPLQRFAGRTLGVATIHGKEEVIGPALMRVLPITDFKAIPGIDTDRFGAFSGEVQRTADPLTTAKLKAEHGAEVSGMDLVLASEGSFGPYPPAPFISCNEEFLVMLDVRDGTFFEHRHVSLETVFGGEQCSTRQEVEAFAARMKFPDHRIVMRVHEKWQAGNVIHKGIDSIDRLRALSTAILEKHGSVWVETDMRAMANPTRMQVIASTADRFAQELASLCPQCGECWFRITGSLPGLPCELCGWPTQSVRAYRRSCRSCSFTEDTPRPDGKLHEEPQHCAHCNP